MPYARLLYIYDADDEMIGKTSTVHSWRQGDVKDVGVRGGVKGLRKELNKLVDDKWVFSRAVFFTHGNSGRIFFNKKSIDQDTLRRHFTNRGYERLFPTPQTEIYFSGCNVAEDDVGWIFLEIAASIFLKAVGGVACGWTSLGFGMKPWGVFFSPPIFFMTAGDPVHPWGDKRYVFVGPGGNFVKREEH